MRKDNLVLAILWTVALVSNIISACIGNKPSWVLVCCPLIVLVIDYWTKYVAEKYE